jgi:hypothetical protein
LDKENKAYTKPYLIICSLGEKTDELASTLSDKLCCLYAFHMSLSCQLNTFLEFFLIVTKIKKGQGKVKGKLGDGNARKR